jgi:uncharacterized membrane-anchored protein YitT (DUF2179 family)
MKRLSVKKVGRLALDQLCFLVGCVFYAGAINIFALPNQIAQSGFSGVAIIINHLLDTPIGLTNLALNIPLLAVAWIVLGWRFVSKTLWVTVELSLLLDLFPRAVSFTYTDNPLLASLFCGAFSGLGLALILSRGATSGGTDVLGSLVRKRWPHISIGWVILCADAAVVLSAAIVFANINAALYAACVIFVSSRVIDSVLYGMNNGKLFYIFSRKSEEIAEEIIKRLGRGVSILPSKGAYTGEDKQMLLCVVRRNEVTRLRRLLRELDPAAFLIIAEAQEVLGQGFADEK